MIVSTLPALPRLSLPGVPTYWFNVIEEMRELRGKKQLTDALSVGQKNTPTTHMTPAQKAILIFNIGRLFMETGDAKQAGIQFSIAQKFDPFSPAPHFGFAALRMAEDMPEKALNYYARAMELAPNAPPILNAYEACIKTILAKDPSRSEELAGRLQEIENQRAAFVHIQGRHPFPVMSVVEMIARTQYIQADHYIALFEERETERDIGLNLRAHWHLNQGHAPQACEAVAMALEIAKYPNSKTILLAARALVASGRMDDAEAYVAYGMNNFARQERWDEVLKKPPAPAIGQGVRTQALTRTAARS